MNGFELYDADGTGFTDLQLHEMYDEMLDESGPVRIAGLEYDVSTALYAVDPIAYRVGFSDYVSSLIDDGWSEDAPVEGDDDEAVYPLDAGE